jgi:hypothetical protein
LSFENITKISRQKPQDVYLSLEKLRKWNHVSLLSYRYAHYIITDKNDPLLIRKVCCPVCKTIRRIHDEKQGRVKCLNPICRTDKGEPRYFEVISRELLKRGIIKMTHEGKMSSV